MLRTMGQRHTGAVLPITNAKIPWQQLKGQPGASIRRQTPDDGAAGLSTSDSFRHAPLSLSKKGWAGGTPAQRVQVDVMKLR
jgi:hypothetical protein